MSNDIADRRKTVGTLAHAGIPKSQIAKAVGCSTSTVRRDLAALENQGESYLSRFDYKRAAEVFWTNVTLVDHYAWEPASSTKLPREALECLADELLIKGSVKVFEHLISGALAVCRPVLQQVGPEYDLLRDTYGRDGELWRAWRQAWNELWRSKHYQDPSVFTVIDAMRRNLTSLARAKMTLGDPRDAPRLLREALSVLTEDQRRALTLRYGLDGKGERTWNKMALESGNTPFANRLLVDEGLERLRKGKEPAIRTLRFLVDGCDVQGIRGNAVEVISWVRSRELRIMDDNPRLQPVPAGRHLDIPDASYHDREPFMRAMVECLGDVRVVLRTDSDSGSALDFKMAIVDNLTKRVDTLDLNVRDKRTLERVGIQYVVQLVTRPESWLQESAGMSMKSRTAVDKALTKINLQWVGRDAAKDDLLSLTDLPDIREAVAVLGLITDDDGLIVI